jgi:hypothetical protein
MSLFFFSVYFYFRLFRSCFLLLHNDSFSFLKIQVKNIPKKKQGRTTAPPFLTFPYVNNTKCSFNVLIIGFQTFIINCKCNCILSRESSMVCIPPDMEQ